MDGVPRPPVRHLCARRLDEAKKHCPLAVSGKYPIGHGHTDVLE